MHGVTGIAEYHLSAVGPYFSVQPAEAVRKSQYCLADYCPLKHVQVYAMHDITALMHAS